MFHIELVLCRHIFTTNVAKYVWIVLAMPSLSAHLYYFLIYNQTSVFERLAVRTIRFSNGKFEMKITRSSNKNSALKQLKRKIYLTKETENRENTLRVMRSFYGRGFPIQEIAHSFLPITLHQKRCTHVQYSSVLFKFTIKLLVIFFVLFKLLCYIYSLKKWFYTIMYKVWCRSRQSAAPESILCGP